MIIALDQAIPYWSEFFSGLAHIRPFRGREVRPEDLRDADALIVRTVTPVTASLLEGSAVRFVGATSAGTDHIDLAYLETRGIRFSYAAGSNANAVSEYVVGALHIAAVRRGWSLRNKTLAIVGVGHVGSRVAQKAHALGMETLLCDPPLQALTGDRRYRPLDEVLEADIVTLHVPLVIGSPHPTHHLVCDSLLDRLSPSQLLINASRGAVVDTRALKSALRRKTLAGAVLDVWEGEPAIDYELLDAADIGTPHIAGTSREGKVKATEMVCRDLCSFFGYRCPEIGDSLYPDAQRIRPEKRTRTQDAVASVLQKVLALDKDDAGLRALAPAGSPERGTRPGMERAARGFERLRAEHPLRSEFGSFIVALPGDDAETAGVLTGLGFHCRTGEDADRSPLPPAEVV